MAWGTTRSRAPAAMRPTRYQRPQIDAHVDLASTGHADSKSPEDFRSDLPRAVMTDMVGRPPNFDLVLKLAANESAGGLRRTRVGLIPVRVRFRRHAGFGGTSNEHPIGDSDPCAATWVQFRIDRNVGGLAMTPSAAARRTVAWRSGDLRRSKW